MNTTLIARINYVKIMSNPLTVIKFLMCVFADARLVRHGCSQGCVTG